MSYKWYAVPGYPGTRSAIPDPHVVDADGELICTCESLKIAEQIAKDHNGPTKPPKPQYFIPTFGYGR